MEIGTYMEMWKYGNMENGNMEIQKFGNMEVWEYGSMEVWKYGSMEIWKYGNMEIWKFGNITDEIFTYHSKNINTIRSSPLVHKFVLVLRDFNGFKIFLGILGEYKEI